MMQDLRKPTITPAQVEILFEAAQKDFVYATAISISRLMQFAPLSKNHPSIGTGRLTYRKKDARE
jgi:hypothetical protein